MDIPNIVPYGVVLYMVDNYLHRDMQVVFESIKC